LKLLTNFENLSSNPLQDPKAAILTLKMLTGSRHWVLLIIPEAACDKLILVANERSAQGNSTNHREGNSKEGFSKHFSKLGSNFKEANLKLKIV
jgi:hypothetical protein